MKYQKISETEILEDKLFEAEISSENKLWDEISVRKRVQCWNAWRQMAGENIKRQDAWSCIRKQNILNWNNKMADAEVSEDNTLGAIKTEKSRPQQKYETTKGQDPLKPKHADPKSWKAKSPGSNWRRSNVQSWNQETKCFEIEYQKTKGHELKYQRATCPDP